MDKSRGDPFKSAKTIHNELNLTCDITTTKVHEKDSGMLVFGHAFLLTRNTIQTHTRED